VAACGLLYGCGGSSNTTAASSAKSTRTSQTAVGELPPATFASLPPGWRQFDDGGAVLGRRGGSSSSYATSWHFDPSSGEGPAGDLPATGAIVQVLLLRRNVGTENSPTLCRGVAPSRRYPPIATFPPQLSDMTRGHLEGAPQVVEYRLLGTKGTDYHVDLRVDLAPGASSAKAQRALDGLTLPTWGDQC